MAPVVEVRRRAAPPAPQPLPTSTAAPAPAPKPTKAARALVRQRRLKLRQRTRLVGWLEEVRRVLEALEGGDMRPALALARDSSARNTAILAEVDHWLVANAPIEGATR